MVCICDEKTFTTKLCSECLEKKVISFKLAEHNTKYPCEKCNKDRMNFGIKCNVRARTVFEEDFYCSTCDKTYYHTQIEQFIKKLKKEVK